MKKWIGLVYLWICLFSGVQADIAAPKIKDYQYTFGISAKAKEKFDFYCWQLEFSSPKLLQENTSYLLAGERSTYGKQDGTPAKDPEHTLKVWAVNKATKAATDTAYFYGYYNYGDYNSRVDTKKVIIKKVARNRIVYRFEKPGKNAAMLPVAELPGSGPMVRVLVIVAMSALLLLTALFFIRRNKFPEPVNAGS